MQFVYIIIVCLATACFAGEFVHNPAQVAEPGFAIGYAQVPEASVQVFGAGGEFGFGRFDRYRVAFSNSYLEMDSLYRQVYSEWECSVAFFPKEGLGLVGGVGYGLSVDWVPAEEQWTSNRYKAGTAFVKSPLSLSAMVSLLNHRSYYEFDYAVKFRFEGGRFGAYLEYDGESFDVGNELKFEYMTLKTAYRFPEFAVSVALLFTVADWSVSGAYGKARTIWDWFGFAVSKSIRKKTIL